MSARPRHFFFRFTLFALGTMLLIAALFGGFMWMISRRQDWVAKVIGNERTGRLSYWAIGVMAELMPGDRDGDSVCDGAQWFCGEYYNAVSSSSTGICVSRPWVIGYCGDRLPTRWRQNVAGGNVRWPRGFQAQVQATEPILLPKGVSGPPTKGPFVVSVNQRGELEFDIVSEMLVVQAQVSLVNAATNQPVGGVGVTYPGWRMPPLAHPPDRLQEAVFPHGDDWQSHNVGKFHMDWLARTGWKGDYVIEASPAASDDWRPVIEAGGAGMLTATEPQEFGTWLWENFPGYTGPLKFRVIPVSATPPSAQETDPASPEAQR